MDGLSSFSQTVQAVAILSGAAASVCTTWTNGPIASSGASPCHATTVSTYGTRFGNWRKETPVVRAAVTGSWTTEIRVNSLSPGFTETEGIQQLRMDAAQKEYLVSRTPLGRAGAADDIASAALFLANDQCGWITGEEILVGGGLRL
jgi:NADP-dependent 3-hydroxy acid dehydrogenase YdfG